MLRRAAPVILAVSAAATLAGCAGPTIGVEAAPDAANPDCASVMLALPESLADDLDKAQTTSQATAAWGEPGAAVTLRCGVTPPGPSPDCQRVESASGTVDWIVVTDDAGTWRFTTYGREPAVEVLVPPAITKDHSTAFVSDLAQAVAHVEQTDECS